MVKLPENPLTGHLPRSSLAPSLVPISDNDSANSLLLPQPTLPQTELPTELPFPLRLSLVLGAGPCTTAAVTANASVGWLASFPPSSFPTDLLQFLLFGRHAVFTALQTHDCKVAVNMNVFSPTR